MSYSNPDIVLITSPKGIDVAVQSIQQDLYSGLAWLQKSFGRAWEHKEAIDGKTVRIPKVYMGGGEYHNVLPNDFLRAQSFIAVRGTEQWGDFSKFSENSLSRTLSIIFWVNLQEINPGKDYIFVEELKSEVEKIIKRNPFVESIDEYVDERAEDVFDAYDLRSVGYGVDDTATQYLMYPYSGFRFNVTVGYRENSACFLYENAFSPSHSGDITFTTTAGQSSYASETLKGKKIRVFRMGLRQDTVAVGSYYAFDSSTGVITWAPVADEGERFIIEIISTGVFALPLRFFASDGQTTYTNADLNGRLIRLYRQGIRTEDFTLTGDTLTFPAASEGELFFIDIYG